MHPIDRRTFVRAAGTAAIAVSLAGCAGNGNDGGSDYVDEEPNYGGFLDDVPNYDRTADVTDSEEVHIDVGAGDGLQFEPPAVQMSTGTRVVWEWTGQGGDHNVVEEDGVFESETTAAEGHEFSHTFEESGTYLYVCTPHEAVGMKGAVSVV